MFSGRNQFLWLGTLVHNGSADTVLIGLEPSATIGYDRIDFIKISLIKFQSVRANLIKHCTIKDDSCPILTAIVTQIQHVCITAVAFIVSEVELHRLKAPNSSAATTEMDS